MILGEREFEQAISIPVQPMITKLLRTSKFGTLTRRTLLVIRVTISSTDRDQCITQDHVQVMNRIWYQLAINKNDSISIFGHGIIGMCPLRPTHTLWEGPAHTSGTPCRCLFISFFYWHTDQNPQILLMVKGQNAWFWTDRNTPPGKQLATL